jgi:hypothetical protein
MPSGSEIRASDTEREQVAGVLREHAGEGRLDVDELDDRLRRAYAARTRGELETLTSDLPAPVVTPRPLERTRERASRLPELLGSYAGVMALLVVIWAVTGAGYFWPIWPAIGWGIALLTGGGRHRYRHRPPHRRRI